MQAMPTSQFHGKAICLGLAMPATKHRSQALCHDDNRQVSKWQRRFADKTPPEERSQGEKNAEATHEHEKKIDQHTTIEQHTTTCEEDRPAMPPWSLLPGLRVVAASITEHPATLGDAANYRNLPQKFKQARRAGYVLCT